MKCTECVLLLLLCLKDVYLMGTTQKLSALLPICVEVFANLVCAMQGAISFTADYLKKA